MTIYLGHTSAALFWTHALRELPPIGGRPLANCETAATACFGALHALFPSQEHFDVMVDSDRRKSTPAIRFHTHTKRFPNGSIQAINRNVCVASPELAFTQAAVHLSFVDLVELGFCLCGTYAYNSFTESGFIPRPQLSTKQKLAAFAKANESMRGAKNAGRAARYVLDGSASPAETHAAMLLTLPNLLGGKGFSGATLNKRIDLNNKSKSVASKSYYVADLCWPSAKLVVEYDSNEYHLLPHQIAADSKKRNALLIAGWKVISLTKQQMYSESEFDKIAILVAHSLKRRQSIRVKEYGLKQARLRSAILFSGNLDVRLEAAIAAGS